LCLTEGLHKGQSGLPEFIWANRHTWQSWRNRYQQQMEYIDEVIDRYVKVNIPFTFDITH